MIPSSSIQNILEKDVVYLLFMDEAKHCAYVSVRVLTVISMQVFVVPFKSVMLALFTDFFFPVTYYPLITKSLIQEEFEFSKGDTTITDTDIIIIINSRRSLLFMIILFG